MNFNITKLRIPGQDADSKCTLDPDRLGRCAANHIRAHLPMRRAGTVSFMRALWLGVTDQGATIGTGGERHWAGLL